jgi:hypothetical protein
VVTVTKTTQVGLRSGRIEAHDYDVAGNICYE